MYCSNMLELKPIELFRGLIYHRWIAINPGSRFLERPTIRSKSKCIGTVKKETLQKHRAGQCNAFQFTRLTRCLHEGVDVHKLSKKSDVCMN